MAVVARAYVFYGIPIHKNMIRILEKRDESRDQLYCPTCKKEGVSRYCPDDGTKLEKRKDLPGLKALQTLRDDKYSYDADCNIRYRCSCASSDDAHFLYLKDTLKFSESQYNGFGPTEIEEVIEIKCSPAEFKKVCKDLDISFYQPRFHMGLDWKIVS